MVPDLIYDVGLHNGDDTAYYLAKGFRVVGIEANPFLAASARSRFEEEIRCRRLIVLDFVVGPSEGNTDFWLSAVTQWSSAERSVASRLGARHRSVELPCRRFGTIVAEHGVPFYLKIDIETSGRLCLNDLDPQDAPRYVSVEFNGREDLTALASVGYDDFKLIHQAEQFDHAQFRARPWPTAPAARLPRPERCPQPGPSGPFGEDTDGEWETLEQTAEHLRMFQAGETAHGDPPDWFIWFDVHARRRGS